MKMTLPGAARQISAGTNISLLLMCSGDVMSAGRGFCGCLGTGHKFHAVPTVIAGLQDCGAPVVQVSAGNAFCMALTSDGGVWSWGRVGMQGTGTHCIEHDDKFQLFPK